MITAGDTDTLGWRKCACGERRNSLQVPLNDPMSIGGKIISEKGSRTAKLQWGGINNKSFFLVFFKSVFIKIQRAGTKPAQLLKDD